MFKEGRDANLAKPKPPLPGTDTHQETRTPLRRDSTTQPRPIRVGYRSFDRQWVIPDSRIMDMPRADLWAARIHGQVFAVEQHRRIIQDGPEIVFSALIPDFDYFKGSEGGRTLPLRHPDGSPNLASGLVSALSAILTRDVTPSAVLAYIEGVVAHPGFTQTFTEELTTPGIRVPITADPGLWDQAVTLGEQVIWLHTYGESFTSDSRPPNNIRYPLGDPRQPLCTKPITEMPETIRYDETREVIVVGDGEFGPVQAEACGYAVGGKSIVKSWFNYRKKNRGGRKSSPLDLIHVDEWDADWTSEFVDLLTVLTRLVEIEPAQEQLLTSIVAGPILTADDLHAAGVRWPTSNDDRRPRHSLTLSSGDTSDGQAALDL